MSKAFIFVSRGAKMFRKGVKMKNAIKVIAVVLLISVSVFFGVVYYKTFLRKEVKADDGKELSNVKTTLTPNENKPSEPKLDVVKVFRSEFPKKATVTTDGRINNVGGYGNEELKEYYFLLNKYFAILSSNSDNCDITDLGSGIVVATLDAEGTLISTASLPSDARENYLCSSVYDDGIMIVTANANSTSIYGFTLDGQITKLTNNGKSEKAISLYCSFGTVVATFSSNSTRIYSISRNFTVSCNIQVDVSGIKTPVAMFQSGNFVLFANGDNFGKMITFDLSGNHSSVTLERINDVIPTEEGYLVAVERSGKIDLVRFSYKGDALGQSELTNGKNAKIGRASNGYFVLVYGADEQTRSYFLCKHFDIVSENKSDYSGFTDVGDIVYENGKIYFRAVNRKDSGIYAYDCNNHTAESVAEVENAYGMKYNFANGLTLLFTSTSTVGDYRACWGNTDVWIKLISFF